MKLTACFLLAFCLQIKATGFAQNLTLSLTNAPFGKVMEQIEKQTGYNFICTAEQIARVDNVTIHVKEMPLVSVLNRCLANSPLTFKLVDNTIIIQEKAASNATQSVQTQMASAQDITITGKVTDEEGRPLQGASIVVQGTTVGVTTDGEGNFKINIPEAAAKVLVISYVGMDPRVVNVNGKTVVSVRLSPAVSLQASAVVIGYGSARKKDLTGAVSSLASKDFNKGVINSPDQLLQGKVPGVEVTSNSGQPGAASTVKIRGNSSIRAGNDPLYVVDGVPLDGRSARPTLVGIGIGTTPESNPLIYINPNDIAQIDILKDASSAAIYGSRGANGIIAITTKTGSSGPIRLEFGTSVGINAGLMKRYNILDAGEFRSALKKYNVSGFDGGASVDPLKAIANHKLSQNYSLAVSGGNENGKFRASFLGSSTQGYIASSSLDKYIGSFTGQYSFLDKRLKLEFSLIQGHTSERIAPITNNAGAEGSMLGAAIQWNPTMAFTDSAGMYVYPGANTGNPLAWLAAYHDKALVNTTLAHVSGTLTIVKGLDYKFLYAINNSVGNRLESIDGFLVGPKAVQSQGIAYILNAKLTAQTFTHTLSYKANLSRLLSLDAVAGYEYWNSNYSNYSLSGRNFNTNLKQNNIVGLYTDYIQNAAVISTPVSTVEPKTEIQSYFIRAGFNYGSRYYLTGTLRADGSSKFGANNRYGYFPAVAGKWVLSNESFLKENKVFANLALRASWGITGNQEFPAGSSLEQYAISSYNNIQQSNLYNANLKWEQTQSTDIGIDFTTRSNRFWGAVDVFKKNTTNILYQAIGIQPGPATYGFLNLPGHIYNRGIEIGLGATIIDKKDFGLEINANYTYVSNVLRNFQQNGVDLSQPTSPLQGPFAGSSVFVQRIANNQPIDVYYLPKFKGFDAQGNQIVTDSSFYAGDPNPRHLFGLSANLRYKKFTLDLNIGGAAGYLIYNNTANGLTSISWILSGQNIDKGVLQSNQSPNDNQLLASTRYLEKGDYVKLRNMSLSYHFGDVGKYVKQLNVFVSGSNLFVITKFKGFDPEVNEDENNLGFPSRSIEFLAYPTGRTIQFGLNLSL